MFDVQESSVLWQGMPESTLEKPQATLQGGATETAKELRSKKQTGQDSNKARKRSAQRNAGYCSLHRAGRGRRQG